MMHLAMVTLLALAQNDKTRANSYDDTWEAGWKAHCQSVINVAGKTPGFVLHIGDSITYTWSYGGWINDAANAGTHTTEDTNLISTWLQQDQAHRPGGIDPTSTNGLYLAMVDIAIRSMTAASSIDTNEYLTGADNGGSGTMASDTNTSSAQTIVSTSPPTRALNITTVAAAFNRAQFAVVMLGTNDCSGGRSAASFIADLQSIVAILEGQHIAPVLSTIPPHIGNPTLGQQYNTEITNFAKNHGLPLIDFYQEILLRRPGTTWNGTLLQSGDVHPTYDQGGYNTSSSPYSNGGSTTTHTTGAACDNVGYLLRAWLTIQKLKEVKYYVIDNGSATPPADADGDGLPDAWEIAHFGNITSQNGSGDPDGDGYTNAQEYAAGTDPMNAASPAPTPTPTPTPASTGGGGKKGGCFGSVAGEPSPLALLGVALTSLALVLASRKSGF